MLSAEQANSSSHYSPLSQPHCVWNHTLANNYNFQGNSF